MKLILAGVALCLVFAPVALAQQPKIMVKADVPFEFYMGDTLYPQGSYYVEKGFDGMSTLLSPVDRKTKAGFSTVFAISTPMKNADESVAVFLRYDTDHVFLKQIWHGDRQVGWELPKSRTEREHVTVKIVAASQPQTVTVLAQAR